MARADDTRDPAQEAFPALRKLSWKDRTRRVRYVQQQQIADCGAACLAMVLGFHGRDVRLDETREACGTARDGLDALSILRGAEWFGLRGRGLKLDVDDLEYLPPATILHWEFNHFVVFERSTRRGVTIVDPAHGRRFIPLDRFRKSFTGVALVLEPSESFTPGGAARGRLWSYLGQLLGQRHLLSRVIVTSVLLRLFALAMPVLTALIVDRVVPRSDYHLLLVVGSGMAAMVLFFWLSSLVRAHLLLQLRTNLDTRMTLGFLDHLVGLPYVFFQRRSAGDLMMRVNSNAMIREILTTNALSGLLDGSLAIVYLALIFAYDVDMALIVLGLGALEVTVFFLSRRRTRDLMAQGLETQAISQGYLVQLMAGIETLKSCGAETRAVEHWSNLFVDELNVSIARGRLQAVVDAVMSTLAIGAPLIVLSYGAAQVMSGSLSLGVMLGLNALAIGFLTPLKNLVESALQFQLLGGYIERIDDVLLNEREQSPGAGKRAPQLRGAIAVDEVSFRYGPQSPLVVRDVSMAIEPGSSLAIVGRSGSGKSTLAKLLVGLYEPIEGRISYDGMALSELDVRSVRRQLGIVPQNTFIFGSSIRDNISLTDPNVPLDRIVEAARLACIHDDIAAMPMGYETILADGGASMSGGQRQRLAFARALVSRPAILLLDEATSSLDANTEAQVMRNLDSLRCTRIIIAHRLSTIANADRIMVMEDGRIVEQGTHVELLARRGRYYELVHAQSDLARENTA